MPILNILEENGDEIIENCDSVVAEIDMDKEIIKKLVQLCEKYDKKLYGVVSNMNIAVGRRDLLQKFDCLICNQIEQVFSSPTITVRKHRPRWKRFSPSA